MPAQTIQRLLLFLFVAFAALTAFQQLRYGMICGRSEQEDRQDDPKAKACHAQAMLYAVLAAVSLIANIIVGALTRGTQKKKRMQFQAASSFFQLSKGSVFFQTPALPYQHYENGLYRRAGEEFPFRLTV